MVLYCNAALQARTIHSWCFGVVKRYYTKLGFSRPPIAAGDDTKCKPLIGLAVRKSELDTARSHAVQWLGLPANASWEDMEADDKIKHRLMYDR